jgi:hypothetical protein
MLPVLHYYVHRYPVAELARRMMAVVPAPESMARSMEVLAGWSAVDRLAAITAPTLVVAGSYDVLLPPAQARRIARRVPGAHLVELAGSAHFPWYDQPAEFFTALDAWYAEQTAAHAAVTSADVDVRAAGPVGSARRRISRVTGATSPCPAPGSGGGSRAGCLGPAEVEVRAPAGQVAHVQHERGERGRHRGAGDREHPLVLVDLPAGEQLGLEVGRVGDGDLDEDHIVLGGQVVVPDHLPSLAR